jgi:hypothetical protein
VRHGAVSSTVLFLARAFASTGLVLASRVLRRLGLQKPETAGPLISCPAPVGCHRQSSQVGRIAGKQKQNDGGLLPRRGPAMTWRGHLQEAL